MPILYLVPITLGAFTGAIIEFALQSYLSAHFGVEFVAWGLSLGAVLLVLFLSMLAYALLRPLSFDEGGETSLSSVSISICTVVGFLIGYMIPSLYWLVQG